MEINKLLIVDDEPSFANAISSLIACYGYTVRVAKNGQEALKEAHSFLPELVVTDVIMKGGDGLELILNLRKTLPSIKIIAMTGGGKISAADYLKTAEFFSADALLEKPFSSVQLAQLIKKLEK
jgi:CheY-like chemotaxis protein